MEPRSHEVTKRFSQFKNLFVSSCLRGFYLCIFLIQQATCNAQPANPAFTDSLDLANPTSLQSHNFSSTGSVTATTIGDFVGDHDERRPSQRLSGLNASATITLHVTPNTATTLEIEERWGRDHAIVGYLILIDDHKTYFRTWEANGAGPVHYFVQIPPPTTDHITVKFLNESDSPFALSRIWAFADLPKFVEANHMQTPFFLAPTVNFKWLNEDADLAEAAKIKSSFGTHQNVKPAFTCWIAYARRTDHEIAQEIDEIFRIADKLQMPAQISFDSWWANTPSGPDGRGGKWNDVKYQQLVWNQTKHQMQLTIPNQWSNTPWLTLNQPDLNEFKTRRLAVATQILRDKYHSFSRELARASLPTTNPHLPTFHPLLAINLDNEPLYWASGNAGLGSDLLWADFNPWTVTAAKNDGVILDPTDGLSKQERLWLWKNLLHYNEMIATTVAKNLSDEPMIPTPDPRPTTPDPQPTTTDFLRNNIYTQAMMMSQPRLQYPTLDTAYPLWEHAAPTSARIGGEWNGDSSAEIETVEHQIPLGRCAQTNAECGNRTDHTEGIAPAFALGLRYYALYNYPLDQMQLAANELDDLSKPLPPFLHEPVLQTYEFSDPNWKSQAHSTSNVAADLLANTTAIVLHPVSPSAPGIIEYSVAAPSGKTFTGLAIEISGRAFRFHQHDPNVNIRILAGDPVKPLGTISDTEDMKHLYRIDLSDAARNKDHVTVRIELNATTLEAKYQWWVAIDRIRFLTPWPDELTHDLPKQDFSLNTERSENLLTAWRADAEQQIAQLPPQNRAAAQSLFDHGQYADAYSTACQSQEGSLPHIQQIPLVVH